MVMKTGENRQKKIHASPLAVDCAPEVQCCTGRFKNAGTMYQVMLITSPLTGKGCLIKILSLLLFEKPYYEEYPGDYCFRNIPCRSL